MMGTLVLPPFVAAAIVEHAKRRRNSAGYLIGNRTGDQITITDYIPCTHETAADVRSRPYAEELQERVNVKRYYSPSMTLVGWYAAYAPEEEKAVAYEAWCQAPGGRFSRTRSHNQAVMLLGRMPTTKDISIHWEAFITSNFNDGDTLRCVRTQPLAVVIEAETQSMNVLLSEIASKALYDGGSPYPTSRITNLDRVAFEAAIKETTTHEGGRQNNRKENETRGVEAALVNVQNKLHQTISNARAILSSDNKKNQNKEQIEGASAILENYETIVAGKNQKCSRDDFITENYKDALMMKYTSALLRRHVLEIERHGRYEAKEKTHHPHGNQQGTFPNPSRKTAAFRQ